MIVPVYNEEDTGDAVLRLIRREEADVVYGSRYLDRANAPPLTRFRLAVESNKR